MKFWQKEKAKQPLTVFTFHTVSEALHFERMMQKEKAPVRLRPVPRMISSSCGTCAVIKREEEDKALAIIHKHELPYHELHRVEE